MDDIDKFNLAGRQRATEDAKRRALDDHKARVIAAGLLPDGLDVAQLTPRGRKEIRDAIDVLLDLNR